MNLEVFYKNREVPEKGFDEFLSCASIYENNSFCLRQLLRETSATLRTHAFWKFLTPMLTQRLRDPYARSVF